MEADSWSCSPAASKRRQPTLQSLFDACLGLDEIDEAAEEDDSPAEFPCPFCSEEFDVIGLCCHIDDEHPGESMNGVCPICETRVGMDMVDHIAMHHGSLFKMPRKSRVHKGSSGFHSILSMLTKDLCDDNLQSVLGGSSYTDAPSNAAPDPLLSSFILNFPVDDTFEDARLENLDERSMIDEISDEGMVESVQPSLSQEDRERARRSDFVQELVLSSIFEDPLLMAASATVDTKPEPLLCQVAAPLTSEIQMSLAMRSDDVG